MTRDSPDFGMRKNRRIEMKERKMRFRFTTKIPTSIGGNRTKKVK
jgi:hypothetical protein